MGEAAAALSIQPPTVTKMVNRLSAAQLVKTEVMDGDRRKISVSLTDAARAKIDEIDAIWQELEVQALEEINPQPLQQPAFGDHAQPFAATAHDLSQSAQPDD